MSCKEKEAPLRRKVTNFLQISFISYSICVNFDIILQ